MGYAKRFRNGRPGGSQGLIKRTIAAQDPCGFPPLCGSRKNLGGAPIVDPLQRWREDTESTVCTPREGEGEDLVFRLGADCHDLELRLASAGHNLIPQCEGCDECRFLAWAEEGRAYRALGRRAQPANAEQDTDVTNVSRAAPRGPLPLRVRR